MIMGSESCNNFKGTNLKIQSPRYLAENHGNLSQGDRYSRRMSKGTPTDPESKVLRCRYVGNNTEDIGSLRTVKKKEIRNMFVCVCACVSTTLKRT
jgi:hypothetical protein